MTKFVWSLVTIALLAFQLSSALGTEDAGHHTVSKFRHRIHHRFHVSHSKPKSPLPVFLFHGVMADASVWKGIAANLTAERHVVVPLNFCQGECTKQDLNWQVARAIMQIRTIVKRDKRFQDGYMFVGHSQGALLARAVIELMSDHKVKVFVSLAGAQNGIFYGPQTTDLMPSIVFLEQLGPWLLTSTGFNMSTYSREDIVTGKLSCDFNDFWFANAKTPLGIFDLARSPVEAAWRNTSNFLAILNNINTCKIGRCRREMIQRRDNFARLQAAHFFASPADNVLSPWQTAIFGRYQAVNSSEELRTSFSTLQVLDMNVTDEYVQNTYGLRTLDKSKRLFLHVVPQVTHSCWVQDFTVSGNLICSFQAVYDRFVYPVLHKY